MRTQQYNRIEHPFEPVYCKDSRILILGSFPSVKSREQNYYYSHPQNRFWKLIAGIYGSDIPTSIEEKKELILSNGLALWDVIKSCDISGSSDSSIKNAVPNDINNLIQHTDISKVICNGSTAGKLYEKLVYPTTGIHADILPSTSPANAAYSLEKLTKAWQQYLL